MESERPFREPLSYRTTPRERPYQRGPGGVSIPGPEISFQFGILDTQNVIKRSSREPPGSLVSLDLPKGPWHPVVILFCCLFFEIRGLFLEVLGLQDG